MGYRFDRLAKIDRMMVVHAERDKARRRAIPRNSLDLHIGWVWFGGDLAKKKPGKAFLSKNTRAAMIPLMEVGSFLAGAIRARVRDRGEDPTGQRWDWYSAGTHFKPWVEQGLPQPAGHIATSKKGAKLYGSYAAWKRALGESRWNFHRTGQMWKSLRVSARTPTKVIVQFSGTRKDKHIKRSPQSNASVARLVSRKLPTALLETSNAERKAVEKQISRHVESGLINALMGFQQEFDVMKTRQQALSLGSRAAQLGMGITRGQSLGLGV